MFTSIHLQNYKTFTDTTIELSSNSTKAKNLVLLYGENGAGKSNFASIFLCFADLIRTMDVRDMFQELMENYKEAAQHEGFLEMLKSRFKDIETIIKDSRTIDSTGNLLMEFSFIINGKKGKYLIETDNKEIVHERLEYTLEKNKGLYFDISQTYTKLNEKIFINKTLLADIKINIEKYWGKHSLLAIIYHEFSDKSSKFLEGAFSEHFSICLEEFFVLSCRVKKADSPEYGVLGLAHPILARLESGTIHEQDISQLDKAEKMLNKFLTKVNPNIKKVYYKRKTRKDKISYELYTRQAISGTVKDIDFSLESTGTHNLLELLPFFINASKGHTVIIDELDNGIHDLLVQYLLEDTFSELSGQLIITTHNTHIMSSSILPSSSFYTIKKDDNGTRTIKCITAQEERVHPYHNKQHRYITGEYEAVPAKLNLSIKELSSILD